MCCQQAVAALRRHRCCILRATLRRQRRIQLSQPQNKLGRGTASIGGGDDDGRAHTRLPPPTHTHMGFVQNSVKKTKTRRLKMAQFALCRQHRKQNDINRQCEWKVYSGSRRFEGGLAMKGAGA